MKREPVTVPPPTYISGRRLSCLDSKSNSTINRRNKVLLDRCELIDSGDLVPTDTVLSKVVPTNKVLNIVGELVPIATVLSNVKGDLVPNIMVLRKTNPATASYQ